MDLAEALQVKQALPYHARTRGRTVIACGQQLGNDMVHDDVATGYVSADQIEKLIERIGSMLFLLDSHIV